MPTKVGKFFGTLLLLTLLLISSFLTVKVTAAANSNYQWNGDSNFPYNYNYSPQNAINTKTVQNLQVKWIFPVPPSPSKYLATGGGFGAPNAVIVTPLIINGLGYFLTNYFRVYALDIAKGTTIWSRDLPILNVNSSEFFGNFILSPKAGIPVGHFHNDNMLYTEKILGQPLLWITAQDYQVFAINALTGDIVQQFQWLDLGSLKPGSIPGNYGVFDPFSPPNFAFDETRGIMVIGTNNGDCQCEARGFLEGWNVNVRPPVRLWGPTFLIPPQDGSDPSWVINSVNSMVGAYIFDGSAAIDLKTLSAQQQHDILYGDWGNFGFNGTRSYAGQGVSWGGPWAVDQQTGITYFGTANVGSDWNATYRPGPNLWSNSIMAIDETTGKFVWGFQSTAHDLWDVDCSWNVMLANVTIGGQTQKAIIKGCKNGYLYELNAATGKMLWFFDAPSIKRTLNNHLLDPMNKAQMTKPWFNYPSTKPDWANPNSGYESDIGFDPVTNLVFADAWNNPGWFVITNVGPKTQYNSLGLNLGAVPPFQQKNNSTLYALDASTGKPVWSHFFPFNIRGTVTISGGLVFVSTPDGILNGLDEKTGQTVYTKFLGNQLIIQPSIGSDANGEITMVQTFGGPQFGGATSSIVALSLAAPAAAATQTATTTAIQTSTVISTVSAPSGIDPTTFYSLAAVTVVFVIATGILAVRRRKPVS